MALSVALLDWYTGYASSSSLTASGLGYGAINANVGDMVIAAIAADNAGTSGAASISGVTDSAGNTYTLQKKINRDPGGANAGVTLAVYTSVITTSLSSGSVTVSFSPNTKYKALVVFLITAGTGNSPVVKFVDTGVSGSASSLSYTSSTLAVDDLVMGFAALEDHPVSNPTLDSDTTRGTWEYAGSVVPTTMYVSYDGTNYQACLIEQDKIITGSGTQTWNVSFSGSHDYAAVTIGFNESSGGSGYTIEHDGGTYSVTGDSVGLLRGLLLGVDAGSYTVTGQTAALFSAPTIAPDTVNYTVTGSDVTFASSNHFVVDAGAYTVTGDDITFSENSVIAADAGSYVVTGQTATLKSTYKAVPDSGIYAVTGSDVTFRASGRISVDSGSYVVSGQAVTFASTGRVVADAGSYVVTGQDISFLQDRIYSVETGSYEVTGGSAGLLTDSASVVYDIRDIYQSNSSKMLFWRAVRAKEQFRPKDKF